LPIGAASIVDIGHMSSTTRERRKGFGRPALKSVLGVQSVTAGQSVDLIFAAVFH
jgi:hypothetical protein